MKSSGKGRGIFGPTWGCQITRLRTNKAKRLQINITKGFCQSPNALSLTADSITASKFESIMIISPSLQNEKTVTNYEMFETVGLA
ncbi:hypothetical protein OSCI_3600009 [Kamptonema sp. PCC 6506]|nr:hypothetical protein OSCI_3600009 [Kamptonema sp. PCC 6506]